MFERLKNRWYAIRAMHDGDEPVPYVPVPKDGEAKISDPEQIPETHCDITSKDDGERYLGLRTGVVYVKVAPWELDD